MYFLDFRGASVPWVYGHDASLSNRNNDVETFNYGTCTSLQGTVKWSEHRVIYKRTHKLGLLGKIKSVITNTVLYI